MCITITTYTCHHRTEDIIPCKSRPRSTQKKTSFLSKLLCNASSTRCTSKPGHREIYTPCPKCLSLLEKERLRKERETEIRIMLARDAHNQAEKARLEERRRSDKKAAFRCSKCAAERRRPDQMSRAAKGGLCCANGIEEWNKLQKEQGYRAPRISSSKANSNSRLRPAPQPTREQRFPELRFMTSREKIREDAKAAANSYGWDRIRTEEEDLEPGLVSSYVNASGANPNALPAPYQVTRAQPKYEDLGIDFTVWRQIQDVKLGAHGRIPPPPEKPLPVRPLALASRSSSQKIARKPVPINNAGRSLTVNTNWGSSSRGPPSPDSQVSPMSPPKPRQKVQRSSASVMNGELFDMLDDSLAEWEHEPMPEPRYRY